MNRINLYVIWTDTIKAIVVVVLSVMVAVSVAASSKVNDKLIYLETGKFRPAFDHLGEVNQQIDSVAASGCTVTYAGLGGYSYTGLPAKADLQKLITDVKAYNFRGHSKNVPVMLSYLCATSIVNIDTFTKNWKDYAPDLPDGIDANTLLQKDINGNNLPSWYGAPYNPADMWNPVWRQYQKFLIKLVIQSGHEGVFYDNPTVHVNGNYSQYAMSAWNKFLLKNGVKVKDKSTLALRDLTKMNPRLWMQFRATEAADFFREMRDYGRSIKPDFILTANDSLNSWDSFYSQPRAMGYSIFYKSQAQDFITIEDMSMSPRRDGSTYISYAPTIKMVHAIGHNKPLSVCTIANSSYITPPNMMKLAIAECTSQDAAYMVWACWDKQYREANEQSVKQYHDFLEKHSDLFKNSKPISDTVLIWPYDNWLEREDCPIIYLAQYLSANNILYDSVIEDNLTAAKLLQYKNAVWSTDEPPHNAATNKMLEDFVRSGRKTFAVTMLNKTFAELNITPSVSIKSVPGVRASACKSQQGYLLHLYNLNVMWQDAYHDKVEPAGEVEVSWLLPKGVEANGLKLICLTPDKEGSSGKIPFKKSKSGDRTKIAFTVPKLYIWNVIYAEPAI